MSGSLLWGVIGGAVKAAEGGFVRGLQSGLRYFRQTEQVLAWALKTGNEQAMADAGAVFAAFAAETYDEYGNLVPQVITAIEAGSVGMANVDPWQGSRVLEQLLWVKWGGAAGLTEVTMPVSAPAAPPTKATEPAAVPVGAPDTADGSDAAGDGSDDAPAGGDVLGG